MILGDRKRWFGSSLVQRYKIFWRRQGRGSSESDRHGEGGGGREVAESSAGSDGPRYARTETGESQVEK